jgi:hypothetical protein
MGMGLGVSRALLAAGAAIVVAALIWWWTTFGDVVRYGYLSWREAGRCLVSDSDICALAKVLCLGAHPRILAAYWTSAFWIGLGVLSFAVLTPSLRREAR